VPASAWFLQKSFRLDLDLGLKLPVARDDGRWALGVGHWALIWNNQFARMDVAVVLGVIRISSGTRMYQSNGEITLLTIPAG
jgi:hypothetical protein